MSALRDLTGQRFTRLLVVKRHMPNVRGRAMWECICDCGKPKITMSERLVNKITQSCGCLQTESSRVNIRVVHEKNKKPDTCLTGIFCQYRGGANSRKLKFELTKEQLERIISQVCFYCDDFPNNKFESDSGDTLYYNGIDRVNPLEGYNVSNCVPCCKVCNFMKKSLTAGQFIEHIHKIASKHTIGKGAAA